MAPTDCEASAYPLEPLTEDELHDVTTLLKGACRAEAIRADPTWQNALQQRGIDDFSLVSIDPSQRAVR